MGETVSKSANLAGEVSLARGNSKIAETHFKVSAVADKKNFLSHYNLAVALQHAQKHEEAIQSFSQSIELHPDHYLTYHKRAVSHFELGVLDKARKDLEMALSLYPDHIESYFAMGNVLCKDTEYEEALRYYSVVLEHEPKHAQCLHNRGVVFAALGNEWRALDSFTLAVEADPQFAQGYVTRGIAYSRQGSFEEAANDFTSALEMLLLPQTNGLDRDSASARVYVCRGNAMARLGRYELAEIDYEVAAKLAPRDAEVEAMIKEARQKVNEELSGPKITPARPVTPPRTPKSPRERVLESLSPSEEDRERLRRRSSASSLGAEDVAWLSFGTRGQLSISPTPVSQPKSAMRNSVSPEPGTPTTPKRSVQWLGGGTVNDEQRSSARSLDLFGNHNEMKFEPSPPQVKVHRDKVTERKEIERENSMTDVGVGGMMPAIPSAAPAEPLVESTYNHGDRPRGVSMLSYEDSQDGSVTQELLIPRIGRAWANSQ